MFLLKYTPDVAKKYLLKGRPDYKDVTQWLIMRKNNVYAGRLALIRLGCKMEIRLTMLDKSPFTYKKVLRFVERMCIKKGLKETKVSIRFSGRALKDSKPTEAMRQAKLCLINGYSLDNNKCMEAVYYTREAIEASKWFDRRFKAYKDQSSFVPVEGYTVRPYSELKKEELADMQAAVKQHFVRYIGFNADFQGIDANTSYVVLKNEVLAAFLLMSHAKNG